MKPNIFFACVFSILWGVAGCQVPPPGPPAADKPGLDGLKVSDLADPTQTQTPPDFLMSFRVLAYTLNPDSVDNLGDIYSRLSQTDVRMVSKGAFTANGFAVGTASFETAAAVAQELAKIGAVRTVQAKLMIPPDTIDPLSRLPLQGTETIHYADSKGRLMTMTPPGPGLLGWVMSARPDPRFRGLAQVKLFPAYWQPGFEDIRLRMGLKPVEYKPIVVGQVLMRVEEKGIIVLGPTREMADESALNKLLFFLPGPKPKIRLFVIICDSVGT